MKKLVVVASLCITLTVGLAQQAVGMVVNYTTFSTDVTTHLKKWHDITKSEKLRSLIYGKVSPTEKLDLEEIKKEDLDTITLILLAHRDGYPSFNNLDHFRKTIQQLNFTQDKLNVLAHKAVEAQNVEDLCIALLGGADVDAQNKQKATLLHRSVYLNNSELTKVLLAAGANPNAKDDYLRQCPLHVICNQWGADKSDDLDDLRVAIIIALLAAGADINAQDKFKSTPLSLSCTVINLAIIEELMSNQAIVVTTKNIAGRTPLDILQGYRDYLSGEGPQVSERFDVCFELIEKAYS
jgi:ankyrin repeat protein